jgi:hypothetical protein
MFVRSPTIGEQVCVRYENEPEALRSCPQALFRVVPAEGGGLALVAYNTDAVAYGFDPSQDEWRYPEGEGGRWCERLGSSYAAPAKCRMRDLRCCS